MTPEHPQRRESDKADYQDMATQMAVLQNDVNYIKLGVVRIERLVEEKYVTRVEFDSRFNPIQKIVYGLVGLMLTGVLIAIIRLVIKS